MMIDKMSYRCIVVDLCWMATINKLQHVYPWAAVSYKTSPIQYISLRDQMIASVVQKGLMFLQQM